jgi:hypothetical protein
MTPCSSGRSPGSSRSQRATLAGPGVASARARRRAPGRRSTRRRSARRRGRGSFRAACATASSHTSTSGRPQGAVRRRAPRCAALDEALLVEEPYSRKVTPSGARARCASRRCSLPARLRRREVGGGVVAGAAPQLVEADQHVERGGPAARRPRSRRDRRRRGRAPPSRRSQPARAPHPPRSSRSSRSRGAARRRARIERRAGR